MKKLINLFLVPVMCLSSCLLTGCDSKDSNGNITNLIENHTVEFVTNGGDAVPSLKVKVISSPPTTYRIDYLFDAWYLDSNLTNMALFPLSVEYDMTLYAKWLKLTDTRRCENCSLKMWKGHDSLAIWYITPSGFDMNKLAEKDYSMQITVFYNVYYRKDYDTPFDVGYAGAPKYEISILNSDGIGKIEENLKTTTTATAKTVTFTNRITNLKDQRLTLTFSTDNIQNVIYFEDITIEYRCIK